MHKYTFKTKIKKIQIKSVLAMIGSTGGVFEFQSTLLYSFSTPSQSKQAIKDELLSLSQPTYVIVSLCLFAFDASPFPTLRLLLCSQY